MLASASNAIVLGFNVKAEPKAASQAQANGVDIRNYNVIYDAINDVQGGAGRHARARDPRDGPRPRPGHAALPHLQGRDRSSARSVIEGKIVRGARVRVKRGDDRARRGHDQLAQALQGRRPRGAAGARVRHRRRGRSRACSPATSSRPSRTRGGRAHPLAASAGPTCRRRASRWDGRAAPAGRGLAQGQAPRPEGPQGQAAPAASRSRSPRWTTTTSGSAPRWPWPASPATRATPTRSSPRRMDYIEDNVDGYVTDIQVEIL